MILANHDKNKIIEKLLHLATTELRKPPEEAKPRNSYRETSTGIVHVIETDSGPAEVPISNFTATVLLQRILDDGAESRIELEIEANFKGKSVRFSIPSDQFLTVSKWAIDRISAGAAIYPGRGCADHVRFAIQYLSGDPPTHHVYLHTGWREYQPGRWVYLHGDGAIGLADPTAFSVRLEGSLAGYRLPHPPIGDVLRDALRATLKLLDLAPDMIMFPVFAASWRSVLGLSDFSILLTGKTGIQKSELAALVQQHFGTVMGARNFPGSWTSTDNSLEAQAFLAKDAIFVIDDFKPTQGNILQLHAKAERVLCAQGNHSGRGRMRPDGTLRPTKPPRGLIISTGEDVPIGQSLRARMLILEVSQGDIRLDMLTDCQKDAADGLYAQAMAGFLAWLAPQYGEVRQSLRKEIETLRDTIGRMGHARTPEIIANLVIGLRYFFDFAQHANAISAQEAEALMARGTAAIRKAAEAQDRHQQSADPVNRFIELLAAVLTSGRAHLAGMSGGAPENPESWGWRKMTRGGFPEQQTWTPQGDLIGWLDGDDLYLQPDMAFNLAKRQSRESGDEIAITKTTLNKRLSERGYLVTTEQYRGKLTVRRTISGRRTDVIHLTAGALNLEEPAQSAQSDHPLRDNQEKQASDSVDGPVFGADSALVSEKPAQENGPDSVVQPDFFDPGGSAGPAGPIFRGNRRGGMV